MSKQKLENKKEKEEKFKEIPELKHAPKVDINVSTKDDGLKELVEKNIKWCQVIYEQNRKIKKRLTMMAVANYLRLILIVVPIIIGIIFLPPLLEGVWQQYSEILGISSSGGTSGLNSLTDILSQISSGSLGDIVSDIPEDQKLEFLKTIQQSR